MNAFRCPERAVHLSDSLYHRLTAYALAFTAAGVGVIPTAAEAKIIFTPTNQTLTNGMLFIPVAGTEFFTLNDSSHAFFSGGSQRLDIVAAGPGAGFAGRAYSASALTAGKVIGPGNSFFNGFAPMAGGACQGPASTSFIQGPFANTTHRFLGLKFKLHGKVHYGWARFSSVTVLGCQGGPAVSATLTGYAYESVANKSIVAGKTTGADVIFAPEPATLGRLALGAAGRMASPGNQSDPVH